MINQDGKDIEHVNNERGKARKIASLRTFYKYFYKKQRITNNPASLIDMPKLHQKEIVLNAKDTENLLGAVGIMRDIVDTVGSSVLSRAANIAIGTGIQTPALTNGALEQNVHIEATFPNVQKSVEIEQALDNLINVASQRANRSNKY